MTDNSYYNLDIIEFLTESYGLAFFGPDGASSMMLTV